MDAASLHSWWTVVLLVVFVGIVIWAFGPKRKKDFDRAARIPLEDDEDAAARSPDEENTRG